MNFDIGSLLGTIFGSKGMVDKIKGMAEIQLSKFAEKMKPEECLLCVRSMAEKKLLIFRGTFTINEDGTFTITRTGIFDIGELLAKMDPSQFTEEQKKELQNKFS